MTAYSPITIDSPPSAHKATAPAAQSRRAMVFAAVLLLVVAFLLRRGQIADPIAGLDEQFYLLVGDRMWHGELPYVDLWDRKPLGLFLLFAGIRLLPGDGVLAAGVVATLFAAATAWLAAGYVARRAGWLAGTLTGIFYLAGLVELWGYGPQSPVFYSLFIMAAAWLTSDASARPATPAAMRRMILAMAFCGIAIQIKTNAIFEGVFFALWFLIHCWRDARALRFVAARAMALALIGATPTLMAMAFYWSIGDFSQWWFANVLSQLAKGRPDDASILPTALQTLTCLAPVAVLAVIGCHARRRRGRPFDRETVFVFGWIAVATGDFLAIGGYFPHYAIPLLLAALPLVGSAFAIRVFGPLLFATTMIWPIVHTQMLQPRFGRIDQDYAAAVVRALPADVRTRCLFLFEGPVAFYHLTQACRVTPYAFTAHISLKREASGLGISPAAALDAAMARRPGTVVTLEAPPYPERNRAMADRLQRTLDRDYHRIARLPRSARNDEKLLIWRRDDLRP